jgi:isopentenyldiphosphate isomerase
MLGSKLVQEPVVQDIQKEGKKYPPVIVVDAQDKEIGAEMLAVVWEKGLYHRNSRIMVEDAAGRVLLQRRSHEMVLYPGRWDISAAGHVDIGMTYLEAARQEVAEEIGIEEPQLEEFAHFFLKIEFEGRKMYNFNQLYLLRLKGDERLHTEEEEVSEISWFTKDELRKLIKEQPDQVTGGLAYVVEHYYT